MSSPTFFRSEKTLTPMGHVVNALTANTAMVAAINPLLVWKTNAQLAPPRLPGAPRRPIADVFSHAPKTLPQAYAGFKPNLAGILPSQVTAFVVNERAKDFLLERHPEAAPLGAPLAAGMACTPIACATDRVALVDVQMRNEQARLLKAGKTHEASKMRFGVLDHARTIVRAEGLRGFAKGMVPTAAREMPGPFAFFYAQEPVKKALEPVIGNEKAREVTASALTGAALGAFTNPADRINSVMKSSLGGTPSVLQVIRDQYQKSGRKAFTQGMGPRVALLTAAVTAATQAKRSFPEYYPDVLHKPTTS